MRFFIANLFFVLIGPYLFSQNKVVPDSGKVFSWEDCWQLAQQEHPVAKQALNMIAAGKATLLAAKGGFDPKLYGDFEQKSFDSKRYFTYSEWGAKIPTWIGIEGKVAYSTTRGDFINPSDKLPTRGQGIIGLSVPLLQGLLMDERRAGVLSARQNEDLSKMESLQMLNELQYESAKAYWKWALAAQQAKVYQEALKVAETRFEAIKTSFELGERMGMDTLEAFILLQDRSFDYFNAEQELQKAEFELANFLWQDKRPYNIFSSAVPATFDTISYNVPEEQRLTMIANLDKTHPSLRMYDFKLSQLTIESRWKKEKLKPKLNVYYNFLGNGADFNNVFTDNYKWGIQFSSSTLFRNERGEIQLNQIKTENTTLMRDQKMLELQNKLENAFAALDISNQQIALYRNTVENYQRLLELEINRFELGESTLFLINSREIKFIEAQLKLLKIRYEYEMIKAGMRLASGGVGN